MRHGQDIAQFKLSNKTAGLDKIWVNSAGAAVGYGYEKLNGETYDLPFILDGSVLRDLNSLIPAGWILDDATGISNAGQIIGNGWHNGARQGFLLTPIPGTVSDTLGPTDVALTTVATVSQRNSNHQKHHHRRSTASATRKGTVMLPRAFYGFA